jgi:hypothetical protein
MTGPFHFRRKACVQGNRIQDLEKVEIADLIMCSLVPTERGGAMVFSWVEERHGGCSALMKSLDSLPTDRIPDAIVRFVFESGENVFFSRTWWEALHEKGKEKIQERANSGMPERDPACLVDDGVELVRWKINRKLSNL